MFQLNCFIRSAIVAGLLVLASQSALAHGGEDHGAAPLPVSSTIAPRTAAASADFELVAIARGEQVQIYLDSFKTNEPVNGATLDVDIAGALVTATANGDGAYVLTAPALAKPGTHNLAITIQTPETIDVLTATLVIPEAVTTAALPVSSWSIVSTAEAKSAAQSIVKSLRSQITARDAGLALVGFGAFVSGIIVAGLWFSRRASKAMPAAILVAALALSFSIDTANAQTATAATPPKTAAKSAERDLAQRFADGSIFVPKPTQRVLAIRTMFTEENMHQSTIELPGRIIPDPNGSGIVQSSRSGRLIPLESGFPRLGTRVKKGEVLATVMPVQSTADVTSQEVTKREIEQEIALVNKQLKRWRSIPNTVPRLQVEDAELELQGLTARLASLTANPNRPEELLAPIDGTISAVRAVAGQIAEPNAVIFEIINPSRYWVEALSFEVNTLGETASARFPDNTTIDLAYRGTGLADRAQAVHVQFEITGNNKGLRAGQFLTVLAPIAETTTGIAVPRTSVLRSANGQSVVYEKANSERFVPRDVRVLPLDGDRVLIVSGVEPGKRIVTQGAELLNQIR
ncbi:MAG: efflux RND transporter periplasmic adaptor subunit [Notoacmeibacter sp.]